MTSTVLTTGPALRTDVWTHVTQLTGLVLLMLSAMPCSIGPSAAVQLVGLGMLTRSVSNVGFPMLQMLQK